MPTPPLLVTLGARTDLGCQVCSTGHEVLKLIHRILLPDLGVPVLFSGKIVLFSLSEGL